MITTTELAVKAGLSPSHMRRIVKTGQVPGTIEPERGGHYRFKESARLSKWISDVRLKTVKGRKILGIAYRDGYGSDDSPVLRMSRSIRKVESALAEVAQAWEIDPERLEQDEQEEQTFLHSLSEIMKGFYRDSAKRLDSRISSKRIQLEGLLSKVETAVRLVRKSLNRPPGRKPARRRSRKSPKV